MRMNKEFNIYRPAAAAVSILLALSLAACGAKKPGTGETGAGASVPAEVNAPSAAPSTVELSAKAIEIAGVTIEKAVQRTAFASLALPAEVGYNQKAVVGLAARVAGRIERMTAFPGDRVARGQVLFLVYSPDYLTLQAELFQAAKGAASAGADGGWASILASARNRLYMLGLTVEEVASIEKTGKAADFLAVRSPISGTVVECGVSAGGYVEVGAPLLKLADLSSVWLAVHIFEKDLSSVSAGAKAEITVAAWPGESFHGTLDLVGAVMDEATRTVVGRVEAANPSGRLKPGMFADVRLVARNAVTFLAVPEEAVRTINKKGLSLGALHFSQVYPLFPGMTSEWNLGKRKLVCLENNATGQFAGLLKREIGLDIDHKILKYNGECFTADEIRDRLLKIMEVKP